MFSGIESKRVNSGCVDHYLFTLNVLVSTPPFQLATNALNSNKLQQSRNKILEKLVYVVGHFSNFRG